MDYIFVVLGALVSISTAAVCEDKAAWFAAGFPVGILLTMLCTDIVDYFMERGPDHD